MPPPPIAYRSGLTAWGMMLARPWRIERADTAIAAPLFLAGDGAPARWTRDPRAALAFATRDAALAHARAAARAAVRIAR